MSILNVNNVNTSKNKLIPRIKIGGFFQILSGKLEHRSKESMLMKIKIQNIVDI